MKNIISKIEKGGKMRQCKQNQCIFLNMQQGCKKCSECDAPSFLIAQDCIRCDNCENIPNRLRWDDQNEGKIEEKELEVAEIIT